MNLGTVWWMNQQRRRAEGMAEDAERRAARETDPRRKARLQLEAQMERQRAARYATPGFRL